MQLFYTLRLSLILLACWSKCIAAMQFAGPSMTLSPGRLGLEVVLAPTASPSCLPNARGLRNRQDSVSLATCGFIGGDADLPVTCGTELYCATTSTYVGCCEAANCVGIFTTCYDLLGSSCDATCQNNQANLVCPASLPYCAEYQYEGGSIGYGCALNRGYTTTVLLTTKETLGSVTTPTASSTNDTGTAASQTATGTTSSTPVPVASSSGIGGGAIAGIAIGAAAGVAIIVALVWMMRRRKRKAANKTVLHADSPDMQPGSGPQMGEQISNPRYSDATTAYALPSPRTDPWKQSWQGSSENGSSYAPTNRYSAPMSLIGMSDSPAEMPAPVPDPRTIPSELDASHR